MNDYPTDEQLQFIRDYDIKQGPDEIVERLKEIWHWPEMVKFDNKSEVFPSTLELHTCGWSGNEDIITALAASAFWLFYWQKSERGGHYYFLLPRLEAAVKEK